MLLAALAALVWYGQTPPDVSVTHVEPSAPPPPPAPAPVRAATPVRAAVPVPSSAGLAALEAPPPGTTPEQPPDAPAIELPPTTQVLAEEFYPGTTEWEDIPLDDAHQYRLRILPTRYNVVAPRPLALWLELTDAQGRRQPLSSPRVRARLLDDASRPWLDVPVGDDGTGEDERAGDRRYTAQLRPTREQQKQLLGRVLVEATVDVPGGGVRTIPSVVIYTRGPRAALTGRWTDAVRDGGLALEAELRVEEAGLFTLMAQVFGPHQEPIAWVKQTAKLEAGTQRMTLHVFGKVLHDMGVDGPYRVRQVLLTRDQENSGDYDPGETVEEAHQTKPYAASAFSSAPYVPPPRTLREITAEHPSQRDKPPPERTREMAPAPSTASPSSDPNAPPAQATDLAP
ncbi:hypothetical protein [Archangium primigenium]|uniref:hypothetical protein n=1 Tax=[Archangium] primigenium TaxID=2792470 RepID=UPI00195D2392|nr:hypothetical protein [Archangium primigenium]MBM7112846.1 hypothetical protein [Archangium primigenium]